MSDMEKLSDRELMVLAKENIEAKKELEKRKKEESEKR